MCRNYHCFTQGMAKSVNCADPVDDANSIGNLNAALLTQSKLGWRYLHDSYTSLVRKYNSKHAKATNIRRASYSDMLSQRFALGEVCITTSY